MNLKKLLCILLIIGATLSFSACNKKCKNHVDENKNGICDECGEEVQVEGGNACQHRDADDNSLCDKCGESFTDEKDIVEHTHTYDQKKTDSTYLVSAANCETAATYYHSCSCGEKGTTTFTSGDPLHNYTVESAVETYLAAAASCENAATYYYSCTCGAKGSATFASGEALGHRDIDDNELCDRCNKEFSDGKDIEDHVHTFDQENLDVAYLESSATCEEAAVYCHSCSCGAKGTTTFTNGEPLGHKDANGDQVCDVLICLKDLYVIGEDDVVIESPKHEFK